MRKTRKRKSVQKAAPVVQGVCAYPDCGRPARGELCQSHRRQKRLTGELKPIRPYRPRSSDTVKFSGLRLSPRCAEQIEAYALAREQSQGAAIAELLEDWCRKGARPPSA